MEALSRNSIIAISIVLESALLLGAAAWIYLGQIMLIPKFQFSISAILWGLAVAAVSTTVSILCVTLGKRLPIFAELQKMNEEFLIPLVSMLSPFDILFLSLLSGFCEEVFFRGLMLPQLGLFTSSIVFGIFHDPLFKQKAYVILASLAGVALGYVYQQTGSLWSCITAHAVHNFIAMLALRYFFKPNPNGQGDSKPKDKSNDLSE